MPLFFSPKFLRRVLNGYSQENQHNQPNQYYNDQNYGHYYGQTMDDWSHRSGNWSNMPQGPDSGIHTRDSSAAPSVMSSAYSAFSGSNYSESQQGRVSAHFE